MHALKRPLALLISAALLVVGFDVVTYAATGQSLILGKSNVASKTTTIKRTTGGAVLNLKAKKGSPPLAVNSKERVDNLNADLVDGLSTDQLANNARIIKLTLAADAATPSWNINVPNGTYIVNWQAYVDLVNSAGDLLCGFQVGADYVANELRNGSASFIATSSGSGILTVGAATTEVFFCNGPGGIEAFAGNEGVEIALQKLESSPTTTVAANP